MRNNEQFKAYVYEKADTMRAQAKRMHATWIRSAVAFSLLLIFGGAYFYANGGVLDTSMSLSMENGTKIDDIAICDSVTEMDAQAEAYSYSKVSDALTVEGSGNSRIDCSKVCESLPETLCADKKTEYSCVTVDAVSTSAMHYVIAENALEYNGDLTNIDFAKNVALVITGASDIASWQIAYGEDSIVVTLTEGDEEKRDAMYTILLEKEKYKGQEIVIQYK